MIPSEREVADALDALHLDWEYEPRLFVLREEDGVVQEGFRPDFYIVKHDLYIEVTKGKQPYVTRKNRKARMTRELYPGVYVEIIYRAHFDDLRGRILEILEHVEMLRENPPVAPPGNISGDEIE